MTATPAAPTPNLSDLAEGVTLGDRSAAVFKGFWGFNPCVVALPDGRVLMSVRHCTYNKARGNVVASRIPVVTRTVTYELDPATLELASAPLEIHCPQVGRSAGSGHGIEDLRLFVDSRGGLRAIGCTTNARKENAPEMVELALEGRELRCSSWKILRGEWSKLPQKNWSPFSGHDSRYLYCLERGLVIADGKPLAPPELAEVADGTGKPSPQGWAPSAPQRPLRHPGAAETVFHPRRTGPNTILRPAPGPDWSHRGLRGGSPLVRLGAPYETSSRVYLGIGHDTDPKRAPHYRHAFYLVTESGECVGRSPSFLFLERPIEFAAGLAILSDGRVCVSLGVNDAEAWICTLPLAEVLRLCTESELGVSGEHEDLIGGAA